MKEIVNDRGDALFRTALFRKRPDHDKTDDNGQ
jgi:hypothetical protein